MLLILSCVVYMLLIFSCVLCVVDFFHVICPSSLPLSLSLSLLSPISLCLLSFFLPLSIISKLYPPVPSLSALLHTSFFPSPHPIPPPCFTAVFCGWLWLTVPALKDQLKGINECVMYLFDARRHSPHL